MKKSRKALQIKDFAGSYAQNLLFKLAPENRELNDFV